MKRDDWRLLHVKKPRIFFPMLRWSLVLIIVDYGYRSGGMADTMTLNVRVGGPLRDHVAASVGEYGRYENVSEYVRDLIRRDHARAEDERFQVLKAELQRAFATPESDFVPLDADEFRERMKQRYA
ncbi:hypothetical protein M0208_02875 [Sphingomonas sp. SUN019]|uniref:ribbon-helix-helix domain-containing protein n=1 Tax=Sphingomonas sp. SUN019 TaxID=2937788 RepID=UPI0021647BDC|nr:hypothetical protein [Sphingomonas sp. SUN019]UVO49505.1 hypothetical protein M0208_02875 [Sphingomonas sp. SUN019]